MEKPTSVSEVGLNDLLPCPFCGGSVYRYEEEIGDCHPEYYPQILCDICEIRMEGEGYRWKDDIKKGTIIENLTRRWNTRVAR